MMFKKLRLVGLAILGAALLTISVCSPVPAHALTEEAQKGTIIISEKIYDSDFVEFLKATRYHDVAKYDIILHTDGGDAFACIGIMNRIMELQMTGVQFDMYVHGKSFSAGTYIFLLGDNRIIYEGASLMFHTMQAQASEFQIQNTKRNRSFWNTLVRMDNYVIDVVRRITGWLPATLDWWMNGGEAQFMSAETARNVGVATEYREWSSHE